MKPNIPCLLQSASKKHPTSIAVITENTRLTFLELEHRVQSLTLYFNTLGVQKNDRVIITLSNSVSLLTSMLALFRIGAWSCPVNPKFPEQSLKQITKTLAPHWSITESSMSLGSATNIDINTLNKHLLNPCIKVDTSPISYPANIPSNVILTSGTSGHPKAAVFSYQQHVYSAIAANALIPLAIGDRNLVSLPLFHIGGLAIIFRCLLSGATLVLGKNHNTYEDLVKFEITHTSMVATQLRRLLKQSNKRISLKHALIGGGPIDKELLYEAKVSGLNCWQTYGLTEMSSQVYTHNPSGVGQRLQHSDIMINDKNEICVKGKTLFLGYYEYTPENPTNLRLPLNKNGWFETKDLARFNGNKLEIIGRLDNQFISGGENIQPEEIEYFVNKIQGVIQCIVVAKKDTEYGFRPVIFLESENSISLNSLHNQLKPYLPSFKWPKAILPWIESPGLKVSRKQL